jgi:hypothetical protein
MKPYVVLYRTYECRARKDAQERPAFVRPDAIMKPYSLRSFVLTYK